MAKKFQRKDWVRALATLGGAMALAVASEQLYINQQQGAGLAAAVAALLLCAVERVDLSVINGRVIVRDGELQTLDVGEHVTRHNALAAEMVGRHKEPERFKLV